MRDVSARFLASLRHSHVVVFELEVIPGDGSDPVPIFHTGGDVTMDRLAQSRRTCRLNLPAAEIAAFTDLPFGSYLNVTRGIRFGDGTSELVQLGRFRIDTVSAQSPEGSASLSLADRMAQVRDEQLLAPFQATGLAPTDAAVALVEEVFPLIDYTIGTDPLSETALVDVAYDRDRAKAVTDLAASVSAEAFFDADGGFVIQPIPDPLVLGVSWSIDVGANGVLIGYTDSLSRDGVANGVLVRGQASADTPPITVLVTDDDPTSPTYWGGPFGKVPYFLDTQAVQDLGQATEVAQAELTRRIGLGRPIPLIAVPNPALEPGDTVDLIFADDLIERHIIDTIRVPLDVTNPNLLTTRSVYGAAGPPAELAPARAIRAGREAWQELRR